MAWVLSTHSLTTKLAGDRNVQVRKSLLSGADLVIVGDVPAGAGLSSSAALECAVGLALLGINDVEVDAELDRATLARIAQLAENDFVGAPTGILDQTASLRCVDSHVLFLDTRTGLARQVPFDAAVADLEILVIDTRAVHSHKDNAYGERRSGCERAAELLGVNALRDISVTDLASVLDKLPTELAPLVRHVVTENDRTEQVVQLLEAKRFEEIGPLLTASHVSLRDDYQVSCVELDVAVDAALSAGALGARMTGGGFGGSAIALVPTNLHDAVSAAVTKAYVDAGFPAPRLFVSTPAAGAGRDS
jgi:galactokinase